ncbi:MAG: hypothetical protein N4A54_04060 [Peptostreptococcaceae bacterium]|jgi:hypothetical protein|nr:hypothetical protein [Peptostreptococcaceae bacterium]
MKSYRIIPDFTVDNKNANSFARELYNYKPFYKRININKEDNQEYLEFKELHKCIEIKITKDDIKFYFHFNDESELHALRKYVPKATLKEENHNLYMFQDRIKISEMELLHHYFLSLSTDKRKLQPIGSLLEVQRVLKEDDFALIQYVFAPESFDWHEDCIKAYKEFKNGKMPKQLRLNLPIVAKKGAKLGAATGLGILNGIQYLIAGEKHFEKLTLEDEDIAEVLKDGSLSDATLSKSKYNAFKTTIRLLSSSLDINRQEQILRALESSFNGLQGDNCLIPKRINPNNTLIDYMDLIYTRQPSVSLIKNILSSEEVSKLLYFPTKALQQDFKMKKIDIQEVKVPGTLTDGIVPIGVVTNNGLKTMATWSKDKNIRSLPKIIVGGQNAGKTTYTSNFAVGTYKSKDANFIVDYIQNCPLSKKIEKQIPKEDQVIIDISDEKVIFPLCYSEASNFITEKSTSWQRLKISSLLANQTEYLINSVNVSNKDDLSHRMLRFLYAASMVVFIHRDSVIDTVFKVLRNWKTRNEYIRLAKYSKCFDEDDEIFQDLEELHERDSSGKIVGTKEHLISGILNRLISLSKNIYIKAMLKAPIDSKSNVDFIKLIEQGRTIHIRIPQTVFPDPSIRDTIATFFVTRLWLCLELRNQEDNNLCHLILDEVRIVPTLLSFLDNHVTEFRRHRLGLYCTCHFLKQFGKLLDSIKSANVSYILLAGTEEENMKILENSIRPFSIEQGLNLKPFHSLNIINHGNQYSKFISKLPSPLK